MAPTWRSPPGLWRASSGRPAAARRRSCGQSQAFISRPAGGSSWPGISSTIRRALISRPHKRRVGYIPQDTALFPHLTVAANIGFGLPRAKRAAKVREMLELIDLDGYADRHPHQLSGGQQQRVALARALAPGPDLLLLDEPFSALDAGLRARVRSDVAALLRRTETTAVLVTHDAQEALAFADLVAIMHAGMIVQSGEPEQLYSEPIDADVARALGDANLLRASARGSQLETALGLLVPQSAFSLSTTPGDAITVLVRPRQVTVTLEAGPASKPGHVIRSEFSGDDCRLELCRRGSLQPTHRALPASPGDRQPGARRRGRAGPHHGDQLRLIPDGSSAGEEQHEAERAGDDAVVPERPQRAVGEVARQEAHRQVRPDA